MRFATLLLSAALPLAAATLPAQMCNEGRTGGLLDGSFIGPDTVLVTCWPVRITPSTFVEDELGNPIQVSAIPEGTEVHAAGCLDVDGFTLIADTLHIMGTGSGAGALGEQLVFGSDGMASWFVQTTTEPTIAPTGIGNPDPTLNLTIGARYTFSYANPASHPFALIAKGATSAGDTLLLVVGATAGTMEGDAGVNWIDNGSDFSFTLTPALATALEGSAGQDPGYRCNIHTSMMRGGLVLNAASGVEDWELY